MTSMETLITSLITFAALFGGALFGMFLHSRLPEDHLNEDTKRIVNLGAGIIGTMAALVLGLLVASAKGNYDTQNNELTAVAAKIILLDRGLAFYGSDTKDARHLLRGAVTAMVVQLWPSGHRSQANLERAQSNVPTELYIKI